MIRPVKGETIATCKAFYWDTIHTSQKLIKAIQGSSVKNTDIAREVVKQEQQLIKDTYADLKELQRWWEKEGKNEVQKRLLEKKSST